MATKSDDAGAEAPRAASDPGVDQGSPEAPDPEPARPDALMVSDVGDEWGDDVGVRADSISDFAEPILGGRVHVRKHPVNKLFITRSIYDTVMMPTWHRKAGRDRYRWEKKDARTSYGYLVEGAPTSADMEAKYKEMVGS